MGMQAECYGLPWLRAPVHFGWSAGVSSATNSIWGQLGIGWEKPIDSFHGNTDLELAVHMKRG
eukprot:1267675-Amphidinium_carterae.1